MMDNNKQKSSPKLPPKLPKNQTVSFINNDFPSIILSGLQPLRSNSQDGKSLPASESLTSKIVNLNLLNKDQKNKKDKLRAVNHEKSSNSIFYLDNLNPISLCVYDLENPPNKIKYKSSKSLITNLENNNNSSDKKISDASVENDKLNLLRVKEKIELQNHGLQCLEQQVKSKKNDLMKLKDCRELLSERIKSLNSQLRSDSEIEILIDELRTLTNQQANLHRILKKNSNWICEDCTFSNLSEYSRCKACNIEKKSEYIICTHCNGNNDLLNESCVNCNELLE